MPTGWEKRPQTVRLQHGDSTMLGSHHLSCRIEVLHMIQGVSDKINLCKRQPPSNCDFTTVRVAVVSEQLDDAVLKNRMHSMNQFDHTTSKFEPIAIVGIGVRRGDIGCRSDGGTVTIQVTGGKFYCTIDSPQPKTAIC